MTNLTFGGDRTVTRRPTATCPACEGYGQIDEPVGFTRAPITYDVRTYCCGLCGGEGRVSPETANAYDEEYAL